MFDPRIGKEASAFYEVGKENYKKLCNSQINHDNVYYFMPAIVNLAFSVELFLKANIDNKVKVHCLDDLLKLLPDGEQKAIIQITIKQFEVYTNEIITEEQFWKYLAEARNAFVDWRYFYENSQSINPTFLFSLATALNSISFTILSATT